MCGSDHFSNLDLNNFPQLDETEIHYIWHFDWWDGPLSGMAEYREKKSWFTFHHMDEEGVHYFYLLFPLLKEQIDEAETWISTCGLYLRDEETRLYRWVGRDELRHNAEWQGPDFNASTPIGWFTDGKNPDFYAIKVAYEPKG